MSQQIPSHHPAETSIMEAPPLVARHRFLMGDLGRVSMEGKTYRGKVIGIYARQIEISRINPYGIPAAQINAYHCDTYTVIFYEPRPYQVDQDDNTQAAAISHDTQPFQFNEDENTQPYHVNHDESTQLYQVNRDENTQAAATSHETNNAPVTTHESSHGMAISYAINPEHLNANRSHFAAVMPPGVDLYDLNAYITPYTVILYGIIPGDTDTYVHNLYPMAFFGISPDSINADEVYLDADVPFGTEPNGGVYGLLPRSATIPSYLVEIQHQVEIFYG